MDYKTAADALKKIPFDILIGFLCGITLCLIVALGFSIWIITEQDSFIHNLLLDLPQKIVSAR